MIDYEIYFCGGLKYEMNKDWSEKNKRIQILIGKESTYKEGINLLIDFRQELFEQITKIVNTYPEEAFYQMPYANANGYHNKTLSYSIGISSGLRIL